MKRLVPYLVMVALGAGSALADAIFGHTAQGHVDTVNELRVYPSRFDTFSDNTPEVWSISTNSTISTPTTSNLYPSFQSSALYSEPCCGTQGRAFEFVVNGYYPDGGFNQVPWVNPQNLIFAVENNGGSIGYGFGVTINGDLASLPNSPEANMKIFTEYHNLPVVDGAFDHHLVPGNGGGYQTLMLLEIMYDYSIDGTGGGDFLLNITELGTGDTATVFLPCQLGATGSVVTQAMFGGTVMHVEGASQEVSFSAVGSCTTAPTFGTLRIYHTFAAAP